MQITELKTARKALLDGASAPGIACAGDSTPFKNAKRIWSGLGEDWRDHYMCFRRLFRLERCPSEAMLAVSADSDFVAFLNDKEVGRGQFSDFSQSRTWSDFPIKDVLRSGENVLAVLVFHRGEDFLDHQAGAPGLILNLQVGDFEVSSDESWRAKSHSAFRKGRRERMTAQCGFTFEYDARLEEPWTSSDYDDGHWEYARAISLRSGLAPWLEMQSRPLPPLVLGELSPVSIVIQGSYLRPECKHSIAEEMTSAFLRAEVFPWEVFSNEAVNLSSLGVRLNAGHFLSAGTSDPLVVCDPPLGADGRFFVADLGRECVGFLEFSVEAAPGTILDIAHGEHLDDGRVRASVGGRHFADRYICGQGVRTFQMPFRRLGARFLQVHCSGSVKFHTLGLRLTRYPGEVKGGFATHDVLSNRIHEISIRTLELCRHEHYEDCPWREQALYGFDSRLQALNGYYAFGDYEFPRVSFTLLGKSATDSGFLALTAPGGWATTIPSFSFAWIVSVAEHWLYSGRSVLFEGSRCEIDAIIAAGLSHFDERRGIYYPPSSDRFWHFYEWTVELAGGSVGAEGWPIIHHAGYNLYLHEALRSYVWMLKQAGESQEAGALELRLTNLGHAIHRNFWNPTGTCYCSVIDGEHKSGRSELIQLLALSEGIVPDELKFSLIDDIQERRFVPCMLSAIYYRIGALFSGDVRERSWVDQNLCGIWGSMAFSGASTMWETEKGASDFDFAGSLCHGWSALPVYYHQAYVLGVRPIAPGFKNFSIKVYPSRFFWAEGKIPTPFGNIQIFWEKTDKGLSIDVKAPPECIPELEEFPEAPVGRVTYNGKPLSHHFHNRD